MPMSEDVKNAFEEQAKLFSGHLKDIKKEQQAQANEIRALDQRTAGPSLHGTPANADMQKYVDQLSRLSGKSCSAEDYSNYRKAFTNWMRHGDSIASSEKDVLNTLSEGQGSEGGFWCPPDITGRIVAKIYQLDGMRSICDVQGVGVDSLEGLIDNDEADCGWIAEMGTRQERRNILTSSRARSRSSISSLMPSSP